MDYRLLANLVAVFHTTWIVILIGGIGLQFIFKWYRPIHLAVVTTTVVSQLIFLGCPLVALEQALRRQYDPDRSFIDSFVVHYLQKMFGIEVSLLMVTGMLAVVAIASFTIWVLPQLRRGGRYRSTSMNAQE